MIKHKIQLMHNVLHTYNLKCQKCNIIYYTSYTDMVGTFLSHHEPQPKVLSNYEFNKKYTQCIISDGEYKMRELLK